MCLIVIAGGGFAPVIQGGARPCTPHPSDTSLHIRCVSTPPGDPPETNICTSCEKKPESRQVYIIAGKRYEDGSCSVFRRDRERKKETSPPKSVLKKGSDPLKAAQTAWILEGV